MKKMEAALLLVLFLVNALLAQVHPMDNDSAWAYYQRGIADLNQGNWDDAGGQFKHAVVVDPQFQLAHELYQDVEYFYFERREKVVSEYAELVRAQRSSPLLQYLLARIATKNQLDSLGLFISPLALDSSFIPEYQRLIEDLFYEGKVNESDALIEAGLRHSPNNPLLLFWQSQIRTRQERANDGASILRKIIDRHPDDQYALFAYIQLAQLAQTDTERIQLLEHAVRMDTSGIRPDAYADLFLLYAQSDTARAIRFARQTMKLKLSYQDHRLVSQMGGALFDFYAKNDTSSAITFASEIDRTTTGDPQLYLELGNHLRAMKRDSRLALSLLKRALARYTPGSNYGLTSFGRRARSAVLQDYALTRVYYLLGLGAGLLGNAQYQEALTVLQSALGKNDHADPSILFKMGSAYEALAQPKEAIAAYTRSLGMEEDARVRSALELLAARESKLNIAIPPKRVTDLDSAIAQSQLSRLKHAPDFNLKKLGGGEMSLSSLKGKVVVVDFWATWCGPCVAELPVLQKFQNKYERRSEVCFLAVNTTDVDESSVRQFIKKQGYTFDVLFDKGTAQMFEVQGIPALFIIDQNGMIRYKHVGYDANVDLVAMLSKEVEIIISTTTKE